MAVLILSEPAIMDRYGQLSPIVVNNAALRDRLHLNALAAGGAAPLAAENPQAPPGSTPLPPNYATAPTAGAPPPASAEYDRTIYDTARRIWRRITR